MSKEDELGAVERCILNALHEAGGQMGKLGLVKSVHELTIDLAAFVLNGSPEQGCTNEEIEAGIRRLKAKGWIEEDEGVIKLSEGIDALVGLYKRRAEEIPSIREEPVFEPIEGIQHLTQIENPELVNRPMRIEGVVSSTSISYMVPHEVSANWISKDKYSEKDYTFKIEDPELINFINISDSSRHRMLARIMGVPPRSANISVASHYLVHKLRLRPPIFTLIRRDDKVFDERGYEYKTFFVYIITHERLDLSPSIRVVLDGWVRPDPKTQRATFMATGVSFPEAFESFDEDAVKRLRARFEGMTVRERMDWIFKNFEGFSHIVGRKNLACAGLFAFFTPIWLDFDEDRQHGWGIVLLIGDTTTGKSETVRKLILLLKAGTLIPAETATTVGLTAAAVKSDRGEWITDFGFLPLNDRKLLAVDGYQKLSLHDASKLVEAERQGVVTKGTAAKGTAPARTRQIKIANAVDLDVGRYSTKAVSEFFYPIRTVGTILDKTNIARLDFVAISDQRTVSADDVNVIMGSAYDPDLLLLSEVLKWAWSDYAEVVFDDDVLPHILSEATRLYKKFYSDSLPLVTIDFKLKLARLSIALARWTLSTTPDLSKLLVTKEHVAEVVLFLEGEYTEAGLHAVAKAEVMEVPTEEDLNELLYHLEGLGIEDTRAIEILRFIVGKGHVTKEMLKTKFNLTDKRELRPLLAVLKTEGLVKVGRGFYPTSKLIQLVKLIEKNPYIISEVGKEGKRGKMDSNHGHVATIDRVATPRKDMVTFSEGTPAKPRSVQAKLQEVFDVITDMERISGVVKDEDLFNALHKDHKMDRAEAERLIGILYREAIIYQPRPGCYKRTVK